MFKEVKNIFKSPTKLQREETFDYDDQQEHSVGSHFDPFYEDMEKEVIYNIPTFLQDTQLVESNINNPTIDNSPIDDEKWNIGYITLSPQNIQKDGIGIICGIIDNTSDIHLISMFPYMDYGKEYDFILEKVYVWENGHEAQVRVDIGFTSLCFYDTYYDLNRKWYEKNEKYRFRILGIAYRCEFRKEHEIEVDTSDKLADALGIERGSKRKYTLTGMASCIRIYSWDRDDYSISGLISDVQEIFLQTTNEKAWICTTEILKSGDGIEYDIEILLTKRTWKEKRAPKVGDDIEGTIWLQGNLVGVYSDFDKALDNLTMK